LRVLDAIPQVESLVPAVTTERLILRGCRAEDRDDFASLWGDPAVTRFIGGQPSTPDESWRRLLGIAGHWALFGFGFWLIEERESGRFVGQVGLARLLRGLGARFDDVPEAGWVLASWCHGKGYGTEAAQAALAWGERELAMTRCVCMIDPTHEASLRVAEKCSFTRFAQTTFKESPVILLERLN
jgi:RimJ/RimL family protein N-acetyltransferase